MRTEQPSPSASKITARPTGWSRPSARRLAAPDRDAGARDAGAQAQSARRRPRRWCSTATGCRWSRSSSTARRCRRQLRRDARPAHHRAAAAPAVHARDRDAGRSVRQHAAVGALPLERHLLHAMRGRRLPPHHLFPRPARRDGGLHDAHRGRQGAKRRCCSSNGNLAESGDLPGGRHFAVWHDPHPEAVLSVRAGRRRSRLRRGQVPSPCRAATSTLRIYVEHGKEDRGGYAMDALKRSMRWDEEAFGREYDLDIFMIVAVSDFNMGAMENKGLNVFNDKYVLASARDRDRRRLRRHRSGHRARIFPQLDRQPHHLPRLVPALPEGRPHRLPRPGILAPTCARARSSASPTCAACAPRNSSRMPGRSPIRCGRRSTTRSTTSTPPPSTRRAPKWCACCRR